MALPAAANPPPPKISIVGGPHLYGSVSQASPLSGLSDIFSPKIENPSIYPPIESSTSEDDGTSIKLLKLSLAVWNGVVFEGFRLISVFFGQSGS